MNTYESWNDQQNREPILKIWREINAREQLEDSTSKLQEESSDQSPEEQSVN